MLDKLEKLGISPEDFERQQRRMKLVMEAMGELNEFNFDAAKFFEDNKESEFKQHIIFYGMDDEFFNKIKSAFDELGLLFKVASKEYSFKMTNPHEFLYDYVVHIKPEDVYILKPLIGFWWLEEFLAFMNEGGDIDDVLIERFGVQKSWHTQVPEKLATHVKAMVKEIGFSPISFGLPPYLNSKEIQRTIGLLMPLMGKYIGQENDRTIEEDIQIWKTVTFIISLYDRLHYNKTNELSKKITYDKQLTIQMFKLVAGTGERETEFYDLKNLEIVNHLFQACFILFDLDESVEEENDKILEIYDIFQELKSKYENKVKNKETECLEN